MTIHIPFSPHHVTQDVTAQTHSPCRHRLRWWIVFGHPKLTSYSWISYTQQVGGRCEGNLHVCNLCPSRAALHQDASSAFSYITCSLLSFAATCTSVIRPVVHLRGKPSSVHCGWFNTVRIHINVWDRPVQQSGPHHVADVIFSFSFISQSLMFSFSFCVGNIFKCNSCFSVVCLDVSADVLNENHQAERT